jgi:hypothetical protein
MQPRAAIGYSSAAAPLKDQRAHQSDQRQSADNFRSGLRRQVTTRPRLLRRGLPSDPPREPWPPRYAARTVPRMPIAPSLVNSRRAAFGRLHLRLTSVEKEGAEP